MKSIRASFSRLNYIYTWHAVLKTRRLLLDKLKTVPKMSMCMCIKNCWNTGMCPAWTTSAFSSDTPKKLLAITCVELYGNKTIYWPLLALVMSIPCFHSPQHCLDETGSLSNKLCVNKVSRWVLTTVTYKKLTCFVERRGRRTSLPWSHTSLVCTPLSSSGAGNINSADEIKYLGLWSGGITTPCLGGINSAVKREYFFGIVLVEAVMKQIFPITPVPLELPLCYS